MRRFQYTKTAIFFFLFCLVTLSSWGQLGMTFDIKKPKEYDERVLRSEKSDQKKFTLPRRMVQNAVTHYNYVFNANNRLNEVLDKAKSFFIDDYSALLPFYNYTLDETARDSIKLDSITYKASTGIALHDLRNDWVDNLYLLWGASFYLRKEFDSAYMMFQFINYAFADKEKDGYYRVIGSSMDGNSALSISTKEKMTIPRKIFSKPPSRNDAFIWQIRNYLAQDEYAEAASLIVTLRSDPNFPKRLQNDLHEVQAYFFYKQGMWDSCVVHLVPALDNATNNHEKARWEYLVAQLYEKTGNYKESEKYYTRVANHTTDAIMDVYARLFAVRVNKDGGERYIEKNIAELEKMAKRDKYVDFRDIIYFMAAQMELERHDEDAAMILLLKSTKYTSNDPYQRNKAFLQLAELSFSKRKYRAAYNFYDSLRLDDPSLKDIPAITAKRLLLGKLATQIEIIERQDSLQRIAAMPEDERKEFVKKLVKQLRKQQGIKEDAAVVAVSPFTQQTTQSFSASDQKGEWYFYNASLRSKGFSDFRSKWGTRTNEDNWRRSASATAGFRNNNQNNADDQDTIDNATPVAADITFDALYDRLPLTPKKIDQSNDSIENAEFLLGKLYIQEIEDCPAGTETLEKLKDHFPLFPKMDEVLFNLYYCYNKNGEAAKAAILKKTMDEKYPKSNFTTIVNTGKNPQATGPDAEATQAYEKIYDHFIEGNFDQAIAEKKSADSVYGTNYWTPQLLYIESVYYIKQRNDSVAKKSLTAIITQFKGTPLAEKATTMLDVLSRRAAIEEELRNLVIERPKDDTSTKYRERTAINTPPPTTRDSVTTIPQKPVVAVPQKPVIVTKPIVKDSVAKTIPGTNYTFAPDVPHYVVLILDKVDPVFSNEAKNAFFRYNREAFSRKTMAVDLIELDGSNRLLLISPFSSAKEATDYVDLTRPKTATEIIPWLKGGKYTFSIISEKNLEVLKESKDLDKYRSFLEKNFPGKF